MEKETHYQVECIECKEKFFIAAEDMYQIVSGYTEFDLAHCPKCNELQHVTILVMR